MSVIKNKNGIHHVSYCTALYRTGYMSLHIIAAGRGLPISNSVLHCVVTYKKSIPDSLAPGPALLQPPATRVTRGHRRPPARRGHTQQRAGEIGQPPA